MTTLLILAGVLAYLVAYFAIGSILARRDLPSLWERARQDWYSETNVRGMVKSGTLFTLFFWPIRLPFIKALGIVDRFDPQKIEAERLNQERRIAELERELRIGRRS